MTMQWKKQVTKKNPNDDGEGVNVAHSEDLVGIKNTKKKKPVKIKEEVIENKSKNIFVVSIVEVLEYL